MCNAAMLSNKQEERGRSVLQDFGLYIDLVAVNFVVDSSRLKDGALASKKTAAKGQERRLQQFGVDH